MKKRKMLMFSLLVMVGLAAAGRESEAGNRKPPVPNLQTIELPGFFLGGKSNCRVSSFSSTNKSPLEECLVFLEEEDDDIFLSFGAQLIEIYPEITKVECRNFCRRLANDPLQRALFKSIFGNKDKYPLERRNKSSNSEEFPSSAFAW